MTKPAPGLELDKLIAEKVLGWRKYNKDNPIPASDRFSLERFEWRDEDGSGPVFVNYYSTDIKAAWDLVEKFRLTVRPLGEIGWTAVKKWCDDEMIMLQNSSPTAPHAICLAALFYANEDGE